ncbi:MAG: DUF2085 domain-containing protein [Candidatus Diapherotrites archaeon]
MARFFLYVRVALAYGLVSLLGALFGFVMVHLREINSYFPFILFIISLIPLGIDGLGQLLNYWESNNKKRIITGIFTGIIAGMSARYLLWLYLNFLA